MDYSILLKNEYELLIKNQWNFLHQGWKSVKYKRNHRTNTIPMKNINKIKEILYNKIEKSFFIL
jgi:hypothetical protein